MEIGGVSKVLGNYLVINNSKEKNIEESKAFKTKKKKKHTIIACLNSPKSNNLHFINST